MRQGGEHHWGGANVLLQPFCRVQGARSIECPNKMPSLNKILQVGLDLGMNKGCQGESAKNSMYTCLRWWSSSYEQFMSSWSSKSRTRVFALTQQWNLYQSECFEGEPPGKSMIGVDFKLQVVKLPPHNIHQYDSKLVLFKKKDALMARPVEPMWKRGRNVVV